MKILVGYFVTESNENIPMHADITAYELGIGSRCIDKMKCQNWAYEEGDVELIGSIFASSGSTGIIKKNAFEYIESCLVDALKEHLNEIDGIYIVLHGASYIEEIGSGDFRLMKDIRDLVGPYMPVMVPCDPHGNLTKEYAESTTLIRSYRESPHTDQLETKKLVFHMLCEQIRNRQNIHSIYRKLPLILGGEQSVSADEPVKSINIYMDEMEKDPRILSASWHVGYLRHDCPEAGCGIIVVPATEADIPYAEEKADELAEFVWNRRHEFHYTGLAVMPDEALKTTLEFEGKPVMVTDSGDNTTSGATGYNTWMLRQYLSVENLQKKVLFANICDPITYAELMKYEVGDKVAFNLGMNITEYSAPVPLEAVIKSKHGFMSARIFHKQSYCNAVTVELTDKPITIVIGDASNTFAEPQQFTEVGLDWDDYDIIIVKQGYIFPMMKEKGKLSIMSLTMGPTPQDTRLIPFKQIMRPMFPMDDI